MARPPHQTHPSNKHETNNTELRPFLHASRFPQTRATTILSPETTQYRPSSNTPPRPRPTRTVPHPARATLFFRSRRSSFAPLFGRETVGVPAMVLPSRFIRHSEVDVYSSCSIVRVSLEVQWFSPIRSLRNSSVGSMVTTGAGSDWDIASLLRRYDDFCI